jgi:hypothetical protein
MQLARRTEMKINKGPKPNQLVFSTPVTREQALAEAQAAGICTAEIHPDPDDYDPIREPYWTLPMTLAWVIYRSYEPVLNLMESFVAATRVWRHYDSFGNQ